jgi:phage/plasmid-like protein (TIGR03299 family)
MSHELTIRRNGRVEMAYAGATPWHGLGTELDHGATIETWISAAGMDWTIRRAKVRYPVSSADMDNVSAWRTMDDRHVLLRSDNGDPLGIVSDGYHVVQPRAVLEFFRDLTEAAGFTMETAGTLYGGKRFWALASIGEAAEIADPRDKVSGNLLLSTSCDGSTATEGRYTTVRVVCNNTLSMAMRGGAKARVTHRTAFDPATVKSELGIAAAQDSFEATMAQFRRLAETPIDPMAVVKATAGLMITGFADMDAAEQIKAIRASKPVNRIGTLALNHVARGSNLDGVSGTAWGWLNAVTEYVDHEARARSQDNRIASAWFGKGDAVKTQAYEVALAMADGRTSYRTATRDAGPSDGSLLDAVLDATN